MRGISGVKMRKMTKILIAFMTLMTALSLMGAIGFANGQDGYETVGGEVAPINFITTFLVPALIMLGIFGAIIVLGVIHIKFESDANEST